MSKTIQGFHRTGVAAGWERVTDDAGTTQYLPAVQPQRRQPPMLGEVLPLAPTEPAALLHAWQQPTEAHLERTSAEDRAKGLVREHAGAGAGRRCWRPGRSWRSGVAGTVPAVLTFLLIMATVGGGLYLWDSRTEYAHSRGGIERLRIVESADLEMARIDGELELRRMALEAYINLYKESNRE